LASNESDSPPSFENPFALAHFAVGVPDTDAVWPPWLHVIAHSAPLPLTEHVAPCADWLPHTHIDVVPFSKAQHREDELLEEQPSAAARAQRKTKRLK
jgi:hypothetical protein